MPLYFEICVLSFWLPGAALMIGIWRTLDRASRRAFWIRCAGMALVTFGMEYVYLWADIWNFSEERDPLLGIEIMGAPIEEFLFWFGATPFVLSIYLVLQRYVPRLVPAKAPRRARRRGRG